MRFLFKIVLLSSLLFSTLLSNIDECKSDLYYANGIMIDVEADIAEINWYEKVNDMFIDNQEALNNIGKFGVAYNHSYGTTSDLFEAFIQKTEAEAGLKVTWEAFKLFVGLQIKYADDLLSLAENINNSIESQDLSKQIKAYKDSIKLGHGVIIVSHSQGNLFTNRAYAKLDDWMKPYFQNMGVATPAGEVASDGPYVTFDNDPIHHIPGSLADNLYNENRYYSHTNALGEQVQALTGAFHSFDYYLGTPTLINNVNVSSDKAAEKIKNFIIEKIQAHGNAPSQWETAQEFDKGTINYKITVKHRFDTTIGNIANVYPFAPSKKLYYVQGEFSEDISGYVKASCGGYKIESDWTGKASNEFIRLTHSDDTLPHEIIAYNCGSYKWDNTLMQCVDHPSPIFWMIYVDPNNYSNTKPFKIRFTKNPPPAEITVELSNFRWADYYYDTSGASCATAVVHGSGLDRTVTISKWAGYVASNKRLHCDVKLTWFLNGALHEKNTSVSLNRGSEICP